MSLASVRYGAHALDKMKLGRVKAPPEGYEGRHRPEMEWAGVCTTPDCNYRCRDCHLHFCQCAYQP